MYVHAEKNVDRAQSRRLDSIQLSDELRRSSEGQTKMVRSYIVTGNMAYKGYYFDILDIRDGRKSRPRDQRDYWDLVVYGEKLPPIEQSSSEPLLDLVKAAAFGEDETRLLTTAKTNSDKLAQVEIEAMRLFEGTGMDGAAQKKRARDMLFDSAYDNAKLSILRPISEFNDLMDTRTTDAIKQAMRYATIFRLFFIGVSLLWLFLLWRSYAALRSMLGASPNEVYEQIARLGHGDFSHPVMKIEQEKRYSVIGRLCETRQRLNDLTAARMQYEAKLAAQNEALVKKEKEMRTIIAASPVPKALIDSNGQVSYLNEAFVRCFGYTLDDVPTLNEWWRKAYPDVHYRERVMSIWQERLVQSIHSEIPFQPTEVNIHCKDGSIRNVIAEAVSIDDDSFGSVVLMVFHDITDLRAAEIHLREAKERLEAAASAGIVGIWDWDVVNNVLVWDKVMYQLYGLRESDFGGAYEAWSSALHPEDKERVEKVLQAALRRECEYDPEFRVVWPDGSIHYIKAKSRTTFDEQGKPLRMVGVNYDLTEQKLIQFQLDKMAFYDRLTNLPNRRLLEDRLHQAIALAQRERRKMSLLFIDLDRFKQVNDEMGHEAGDWLLQKVAERMMQCLRASDTAARIGGDEFVVLLPDASKQQDATSVADKIRVIMEQPFVRQDGNSINISSSIGVVMYPDHADNPRDLLRYGDEAMYLAKKGGRNAVHVFETSDVANYEADGSLVNRLSKLSSS
ncbi:hypothetical protein MIZ01_1671 [Sideroxyarcus emersonii]|uniref:Diguanylate cyclase n=2 Tax=Sideroxyarcus emersonii TaxID=2764705 RepID=A0AAN1XAR9_9PROT|nr:hypothetical protein MIZ01_1671 [Sideroxyarcus emersonii]